MFSWRALADCRTRLGISCCLACCNGWLSRWVPAIDNIARAQRLGWVASAEAWIESRQLRNFMIHEYVRDVGQLAVALTKGHEAVPLLCDAAQGLAALVLATFAD